MSEGTGDRRPPQVTWGAAITVVCGVLLVATAFDALAGLRSVDTREQLMKTLDSPEARQLGISIEQATTAMHGLLLAGGAAAAVAAVLGGYAYQRHTGARAGLGVAAVVALIGSLAADPVLGILLVVGAGLLWSPAARVWFRPELARERFPGVEEPTDGPPPVEQPPAVPMPAADRAAPRLPRDPANVPPPTHGFGGPAAPVPWSPPASGSYGVTPVGPAPVPPSPGWRPPTPGSVKAAVALTWTCCVLALVALIAAAAVLANDRARVVEVLREQPGYDRFAGHEDALIGALWFLDGVFVLWTLAAAAVAVFVLRGHEWARVLLLVSAGVSAVVGLAAFPASVFHVVGSAVALGLLLSRSASAWFRHRRSTPANAAAVWAPPPGQGPPGQGSPGRGPGADDDQLPPGGGGTPPVW